MSESGTDRCERCGPTEMKVYELNGEQLCTRHRVEELGGEWPQ